MNTIPSTRKVSRTMAVRLLERTLSDIESVRGATTCDQKIEALDNAIDSLVIATEHAASTEPDHCDDAQRLAGVMSGAEQYTGEMEGRATFLFHLGTVAREVAIGQGGREAATMTLEEALGEAKSLRTKEQTSTSDYWYAATATILRHCADSLNDALESVGFIEYIGHTD